MIGFSGDRFVNDTKTNQQQIPIVQGLVLHLLPVDQVKVNFIRKKTFLASTSTLVVTF